MSDEETPEGREYEACVNGLPNGGDSIHVNYSIHGNFSIDGKDSIHGKDSIYGDGFPCGQGQHLRQRQGATKVALGLDDEDGVVAEGSTENLPKETS